MIDVREKKNCCGCNACGDACPTGAIRFELDGEGFLYPVVDKEKCVNCGLCEKTCPQLHFEELKKNEFSEPKCFAAVHRNFSILFDSTSGGAFSALANVIYRQGGYVGGAIWNEDFSIRQYISDNKNDLPKLRSSKYAQSDAQGFYKAVKSALGTGKPVLVCGCPCQMFALKAFLARDYENLFLIDFICRGNNSPLVFRKYLDWQEARNGGKVVYVKPKNKELGWRNLTTKLVFDNKKVVYDTRDTSYFTKGYLRTNAYCRPSCYECRFKGLPRLTDITIADFWGANSLRLPQELDRNLGTSLVMANNSRGEDLFSIASANMTIVPITWEQARQGNTMLEASLPHPVCDRSEFFRVLNCEGFGAVTRRFIEDGKCGNKSLSPLRAYWRAMKHIARIMISSVKRFGLHPLSFVRHVKLNGLKKVLLWRQILSVSHKTIVENKGVLEITDGVLKLGGRYYYVREPYTSGLGIQKGGRMIVRGNTQFVYGADIEVFSGALLEIEGGSGFNVGATIVCGDHIKIGKGVMAGRHVTIRDNNGGHWMNLPGYKNTKPVEIGDHVWLCEGCTIMPGVKIGAGAVVGAKAVVFNNVPANALVMGNPAEIVCDNVEWKY